MREPTTNLQTNAKHPKCRASRGSERSPDSDSARKMLQQIRYRFSCWPKKQISQAGVGYHFRSPSGAVWNPCAVFWDVDLEAGVKGSGARFYAYFMAM
jgi:hypothetical protein